MVDDYFPKSFSLMMLIHLVGDVHQPLHAIARIDPDTLKNDAGGNNFMVKYNGTVLPLHTIWDETLRQFTGLSVPFSELHKKHLKKYITDITTEFPESKFANELKVTSIKAWQTESYKLAQQYGYADLKQNTELPEKYLNEGRKIIRQ